MKVYGVLYQKQKSIDGVDWINIQETPPKDKYIVFAEDEIDAMKKAGKILEKESMKLNGCEYRMFLKEVFLISGMCIIDFFDGTQYNVFYNEKGEAV